MCCRDIITVVFFVCLFFTDFSNISPSIMCHFKLVLLCVVEGGLMETQLNTWSASQWYSFGCHLVSLAFHLLKHKMKMWYSLNSMFLSISDISCFLVSCFNFFLSQPQIFSHAWNWKGSLRSSNLCLSFSTREAWLRSDGRCWFGSARIRAQAGLWRSSEGLLPLVQESCAMGKAPCLTSQKHLIHIRCCRIRGCTGRLEIGDLIPIGSFLSSNCIFTLGT